LACCASKTPVVEIPAVPPPAIVRAACAPSPEVMRVPGPLAQLPDRLSEQEAIQAWLDDTGAYQDLRLRFTALQTFVRDHCQ
jgi:hypothetical protein